MEKEQILKINKRSFITVCVILVSFMVLAYALTFFLEKANTSRSERIWSTRNSRARVIRFCLLLQPPSVC